MIDYSNPGALMLRRIGQSMGVLRPVVRLYRRTLGSGTYEEKFHSASLEAVRPGDIVWDVGANEGLYTEEFAGAVGSEGKVIAFEPSPRTVERLKETLQGLSNVVIRPIALSDFNGSARFFVSEQSVTDGLSQRGDATRNSVDVVVMRGDGCAEEGVPSVIKIDVEGFELEVLRGLSGLLAEPALRTVLMEVHFQVLMQRGLQKAPREIDQILQGAGFTRTWVDPSHIVATKV